MADEREAPTEDEGERPPKVKKIRSLAEEEMDEESDDEPLLTKRKKKGVKEQEGQHEPFLLAIGGQAGPNGKGGGTEYVDLHDLFNRYGGPPKEKQTCAPRPRHWRTCLSQIFRSRSRSRSLERADRRGRSRAVQNWGG
jgi:hypothetical protein